MARVVTAKRRAFGLLLVKDRIQTCYSRCASEERLLADFKRANGYCGGRAFCMVYTGDRHVCSECKKARDNPKYSKQISAYGRIRAKERAEERKAREEKAGQRGKRTKRAA